MALPQSIGVRLFPQQFSSANKPPSLIFHSDDFSVCFLRRSLLNSQRRRRRTTTTTTKGICRHISNRFSVDDGTDESISFEEAVLLFNNRRFYDCHDHLEMLWHDAQDPSRTLIHGLLQSAVGLHHLFNRNHKGAMMELGEGICKLRKMNFKSGPFHQFEREVSAVLDFVYQTQMELAACGEDICVTMDRSERSYQLLGGYGAGQHLYELESSSDSDEVVYIVFCPPWINGADRPQRVKLPTLSATNHHLMAFDNE